MEPSPTAHCPQEQYKISDTSFKFGTVIRVGGRTDGTICRYGRWDMTIRAALIATAIWHPTTAAALGGHLIDLLMRLLA
jgi:hypothetical protein